MKSMIKGTTIAMSAILIGAGAGGAVQADAAKKKPKKNPEITLMRMGDEGTTSAQLDGKKVWNVRKGYNRIKVDVTASATGSVSWYDADYNKTELPPAEYKLRDSGTVYLECLRKKGDAWYESKDRRRTVITNQTRKILLPVKNPYRCRVTLDSLYVYPGDDTLPVGTYPQGAKLTMFDSSYMMLKATVKSVKK